MYTYSSSMSRLSALLLFFQKMDGLWIRIPKVSSVRSSSEAINRAHKEIRCERAFILFVFHDWFRNLAVGTNERQPVRVIRLCMQRKCLPHTCLMSERLWSGMHAKEAGENRENSVRFPLGRGGGREGDFSSKYCTPRTDHAWSIHLYVYCCRSFSSSRPLWEDVCAGSTYYGGP